MKRRLNTPPISVTSSNGVEGKERDILVTKRKRATVAVEHVQEKQSMELSIDNLAHFDVQLLMHIFDYVSNQKELLFELSKVCRRFSLCILHREYAYWSKRSRAFYYGWYDTKKLKTPVDELIHFHRMNTIELCDINICPRQLISIFQCESVKSLKLFRVKLKRSIPLNQEHGNLVNSFNSWIIDINSHLEKDLEYLETLSIDCCNDLPTHFLNYIVLRCTALKNVHFRDTSCVTNDTIDSLFLLQSNRELRSFCTIEELNLKNLPFVSHESVSCLLKNCPNLNSLSIESCKWISEWKIVQCLTETDTRLAQQLNYLSLIGQDYSKNKTASDKYSEEHFRIMHQLVQQTIVNTGFESETSTLFLNLRHLIIQSCNEQFTKIFLNRAVHGMCRGQLRTLRLSTNANFSDAAGSLSHKPFLIQKDKYHGITQLKELDINMGSLHPSFVTNLLHSCCSQVTSLRMYCGIFFNKGLMLFTKCAKNVTQLNLSDCSFESKSWFTIIAYSLPNLRDLTVKRVHIKKESVQVDHMDIQNMEQQDDINCRAFHKRCTMLLPPPEPRITPIHKLCFDSLYGLIDPNEKECNFLKDVFEIGRLIIYSPKLDLLDFKNISHWDIVAWLSKHLDHIPKHNGLTLKMTLKTEPNEHIVQDLVYIPKLYIFPPSIHTIDLQLESNGFNSHLLVAICCQNVQQRVNIVLSDQCERELVAMLEYHYDKEFTYYSTSKERMQDILVKQIKERIRDLVTNGIQGIDDTQKEEIIQKYINMNSYDEFIKCNHLTILLNNCVDYLLDYEKQQKEDESSVYDYGISGRTKGSIVTYYDEMDYDMQSNNAKTQSDLSPSCVVM
jgi:hypothetical protein